MTESLNEYTYQSLREDIMFLRLEPGTSLTTAGVAQRYKVSRTPAREAILRLTKIGLLDVYPQSRTEVSKIDTRRLNQEWFIRKSLEVAVADDFMHKCSMRDLDSLDEIIRQQMEFSTIDAFYDFFMCDNAFHKEIFVIAEQMLAWDTIIDVNCHYNRTRVLVMAEKQAQDEALEEHKQIVLTMRERNIEQMKRLMLAHTEKISLQKTDIFKRFPSYFTDKS